MTRDDLFNINAGIVKTLIEATAKHAPKVSTKCFVLIPARKVSLLLPLLHITRHRFAAAHWHDAPCMQLVCSAVPCSTCYGVLHATPSLPFQQICHEKRAPSDNWCCADQSCKQSLCIKLSGSTPMSACNITNQQGAGPKQSCSAHCKHCSNGSPCHLAGYPEHHLESSQLHRPHCGRDPEGRWSV